MREFEFFEVLKSLLWATQWTLALSLIAFVGGGIFGLLLMIMRISKQKAIRWIGKFYIEFFQGTPLLLQLFIIFFGIPILTGVSVSPWISAAIALTAYVTAFLSDIWRGCIESIPKTQWEAATALGFNYIQQLRYIIIPQAIKISIPPTIGFSVQVIKNTSLTSIIGFVELTRQGQILNNVTFQPFIIFTMVGAIYFLICYPLSRYSKSLEEKLTFASR